MERPHEAIAADRLSASSFDLLARIVEHHAGIRLAPSKQTMVEGRLRKRAQALGVRSLDEYARLFRDERRAEAEMVGLMDCITTNKTDFFREPAHFAFLQDEAIPFLLRQQGRDPARIKVWSAACSIGAEAYTAAMVLEDMQASLPRFQYAILGTDICSAVLAEAREAIYPASMMESVPAEKRSRYVMASKDRALDKARIVPELRRKVRFEYMNLVGGDYAVDTDVDIILCRNVLIYFSQETQRAVVERLASHLRPRGFLVLGHSESMAGTGMAGLRQVRPTIFQAVPVAGGA